MKLAVVFRSKRALLLFMGVMFATLLVASPALAAVAPTITAVSPDYGSIAGNDTVTITGSGFTSGGTVDSVTFGGVAGVDVSVIDDTTLTVKTPAHAAGAVAVKVTRQAKPAGDGKSGSLGKAFTFLAAPTITNVSPDVIKYPAKGTTVTVRGSNFLAGVTTSVTFNGVPGGDVTVVSASRLTVTVPDVGAGPVTVAVTTVGFGTATAGDMLTVSAKNLTISGVVALDKVYDGSTAATVDFSSAVLNGVVSGDVVAIDTTACSANFANVNAGNRKVTVGGVTLCGPKAGNYTLTQPTGLTATITRRAIVADWGVDTKEYDRTKAADVNFWELNGAVPGDDVVLAWGSATYSDRFPGATKVVTLNNPRLAGTDARNYQLASVGTVMSAIDLRSLYVDFTVADKTYDGTTAATITGTPTLAKGSNVAVIPGDDCSLLYTEATFADADPGVGKKVTLNGASLTGADAPYYRLALPATTTATILPGDLIPLTLALFMDYGDYTGSTDARPAWAGYELYDMSGGDVLGVRAGDDCTLDFLNPVFTLTMSDPYPGQDKPVEVAGTHLTGAQAGSYYIAAIRPVSVTIEPRDLYVDFTVADKTYDGTTAATITGTPTLAKGSNVAVIPGDDCSLLYTEATFADADPGVGKKVTLNGASLTGADAPYYRLALPATTTATILPGDLIPLTLALFMDYGDYTGSTDARPAWAGYELYDMSGGDVLGVRAGDDCTLDFLNPVFTLTMSDPYPGQDKPVEVAGTHLTGAQAGSYYIAAIRPVSVTIEPRDLYVDFTVADKTYDGTTAATITGTPTLAKGSNVAVIPGDDCSLLYTEATFADADPGVGKKVTLNGASLTGADAPYYRLALPATTTATIFAYDQ